MKNIFWFSVWWLSLVGAAMAAPLEKRIDVEAAIITKAELRRHVNAAADDRLRLATRAELLEHLTGNKIYYLVVRVFPKQPGLFWGELEVSVEGRKRPKLEVSAYGNGEWAEYFIPLSGWNYTMEAKPGERTKSPKEGPPEVTVRWLKLSAQ